MANALPGHLHEFYRPIQNATWLGGNDEYSCMHGSRLSYRPLMYHRVERGMAVSLQRAGPISMDDP